MSSKKDAKKNYSYLFKCLLLANFLQYLEAGAVPALLVQLSESFNMGSGQQGLLGGVVYLSLSLGGPFAGYLLRNHDHKFVICSAVAANMFFTLLWALTPVGLPYSTNMFIVVRFMMGLCQCIVCVFLPLWTNENAPKDQRTLWMSYLQASVPFGVMMGYVIASITTSISYSSESCLGLLCWRWPFLIEIILLTPLYIGLYFVPKEHIAVCVGGKSSVKYNDINSKQIANNTGSTVDMKVNSITARSSMISAVSQSVVGGLTTSPTNKESGGVTSKRRQQYAGLSVDRMSYQYVIGGNEKDLKLLYQSSPSTPATASNVSKVAAISNQSALNDIVNDMEKGDRIAEQQVKVVSDEKLIKDNRVQDLEMMEWLLLLPEEEDYQQQAPHYHNNNTTTTQFHHHHHQVSQTAASSSSSRRISSEERRRRSSLRQQAMSVSMLDPMATRNIIKRSNDNVVTLLLDSPTDATEVVLRDDSSSVENTFHSLLPGGFRWGADSDAAANTNDLMNEEIHHKNRRLSSGSHVHSSSSSNKKHKQQQQHNHHQYNYTENQDNNSSSNSWNDCSTALSSKSTTTENKIEQLISDFDNNDTYTTTTAITNNNNINNNDVVPSRNRRTGRTAVKTKAKRGSLQSWVLSVLAMKYFRSNNNNSGNSDDNNSGSGTASRGVSRNTSNNTIAIISSMEEGCLNDSNGSKGSGNNYKSNTNVRNNTNNNAASAVTTNDTESSSLLGRKHAGYNSNSNRSDITTRSKTIHGIDIDDCEDSYITVYKNCQQSLSSPSLLELRQQQQYKDSSNSNSNNNSSANSISHKQLSYDSIMNKVESNSEKTIKHCSRNSDSSLVTIGTSFETCSANLTDIENNISNTDTSSAIAVSVTNDNTTAAATIAKQGCDVIKDKSIKSSNNNNNNRGGVIQYESLRDLSKPANSRGFVRRPSWDVFSALQRTPSYSTIDENHLLMSGRDDQHHYRRQQQSMLMKPSRYSDSIIYSYSNNNSSNYGRIGSRNNISINNSSSSFIGCCNRATHSRSCDSADFSSRAVSPATLLLSGDGEFASGNIRRYSSNDLLTIAQEELSQKGSPNVAIGNGGCVDGEDAAATGSPPSLPTKIKMMMASTATRNRSYSCTDNDGSSSSSRNNVTTPSMIMETSSEVTAAVSTRIDSNSTKTNRTALHYDNNTGHISYKTRNYDNIIDLSDDQQSSCNSSSHSDDDDGDLLTSSDSEEEEEEWEGLLLSSPTSRCHHHHHHRRPSSELFITSPSSASSAFANISHSNDTSYLMTSSKATTTSWQQQRSYQMTSKTFRSFHAWARSVVALLSIPTYRNLLGAMTALYFTVTGVQYWGTKYLSVALKAPLPLVSALFILCAATGPTLGVFFGGWVVDLCGGYRGPHQRVVALEVCATLGVLGCVFSVPITFLNNIFIVVSLLWVVLFFGGSMLPACSGIIVSIVPRAYRATSSSLSLVVFNMFGYFLSLLLSGYLMQILDLYKDNLGCDEVCSMTWGFRLILFWSFLGLFFLIQALRSSYQHLRDRDWSSRPITKVGSTAMNNFDDNDDIVDNSSRSYQNHNHHQEVAAVHKNRH